jgi:hypothetical protein
VLASEDTIRIIENISERVDNGLAEEHGRNFIVPSSIKYGHSKIEVPWAQNVTVMQVASGGVKTLSFRRKRGAQTEKQTMDREYLPLEMCDLAPLPRDYNRSHSRC